MSPRNPERQPVADGESVSGSLDTPGSETSTGAAPPLPDRLPTLPTRPADLGPGHEAETQALHPPAPDESAGRSAPGYEILEKLGQGGMGVVYKARHLGQNQIVALKMILPHASSSPEHLTRFRGEAQAVADLQHANIIQIREVGEHGGLPYFALEFAEGGNLATALNGNPLPPRQAAELVKTLAEAVHYAHERGVIHRDLKPANVLLSFSRDPKGSAGSDLALPSGSQLNDVIPKIADFGLAKRLDAEGGPTLTGAVMGTPAYMAPEQVLGKVREVGPLADVYALGVILFECLTGRPPFRGESREEIFHRICNDDPPPVRQFQPGVETFLETICLKCLAKSPAQRYSSAKHLADDLGRFLEHRRIHARREGLSERMRKWRRKHPALATVLATATLLGFLAAGAALWFWNAHHRETVSWYGQMIKRRGVPEGVGRALSERDARGRQIAFKFYRRGGRVHRVDLVNGSGELSTHHDVEALLNRAVPSPITNAIRRPPKKECRYEFTYRQHGQVEKETAFDRWGNVIWTLHYTTPETAHYTDSRGFPRSRTGSGAAYVAFTWSAAGFEQEVHFLDHNGNAHPDDEGAFGIRRRHDDRGLVVEETWLDSRYEPTWNKIQKFTTVRTTYDKDGNKSEQAWFGPDDKPVLLADGYARETNHHDEHGNATEQAFFGLDGKPALHKNGYTRSEKKYDERGNLIEQAYFGRDGKPALHKNGYTRVEKKYDERGNLTEQTYFSLDDRRMLHKNGYARLTNRYDESGNLIEQAFFALDDKPALDKEGYARLTRKHDERGNAIEWAYFGLDDKPTLDKNGYARLTEKRDERGNLVEQAYFGIDGKPILLAVHGYARLTNKHDERGNLVEQAYFGIDGKPILLAIHGYARLVNKYDERGKLIEQVHHGLDGKPIPLAGHRFVRLSNSYDERGNLVEQAYFGPDGKPALHRSGYARVIRKYDERGNITEQAWFGIDGKPVLLAGQTWARLTGRYDERGNVIESAYFGVDGKPVLHKDGYARVLQKFDHDHVIDRAFFDLDGKPALHKNGYARLVNKYDERGNVTERAWFGIDGKPVLRTDGYARMVNSYDERSNVLRGVYFGIDGRPALHRFGYARWERKYDTRGNVIEQSYLGIDGKPALHRSGYARVTTTYDASSNIVERTYLDRNGKTVPTVVVVRQVHLNSQAARLRLRPGDVLLEYDGQAVTLAFRFMRQQGGAHRDKPRLLVLSRRGKIWTVHVRPGPLGVQVSDVAARSEKSRNRPVPR
jgi:hypothetical protein